MPRRSEALRQRTSNCQDRYFAVRLYIELKTSSPRRRKAATEAPKGSGKRGGLPLKLRCLISRMRKELPDGVQPKWGLAKISRGIKGDTACGNTKQFQRVRTIPVVRTRVPEIPRFQLEFLHVEVEVGESESSGRARSYWLLGPLGWHCYCFWVMQLSFVTYSCSLCAWKLSHRHIFWQSRQFCRSKKKPIYLSYNNILYLFVVTLTFLFF